MADGAGAQHRLLRMAPKKNSSVPGRPNRPNANGSGVFVRFGCVQGEWLPVPVSRFVSGMKRTTSKSNVPPALQGTLKAGPVRQGTLKLSKEDSTLSAGPGGPSRRRGVLGLGEGARGERVERNSRDVPWEGGVPSYFVPSNMPEFDFSQDLTMRARYVPFLGCSVLRFTACFRPQAEPPHRGRHACARPDHVRSSARDDRCPLRR